MPDDDSMLGQTEVDVRNEALKHPYWDSVLSVFACPSPEDDWIADQQRERDLADAVDHLRRLNETPAINTDAEQRLQQRLQQSITRTLEEIQRLMDA